MVRCNISLDLNDNIICFIAFVDVFGTKNGYQKTQKNIGLPDPHYLGLSPEKYHFIDGFPDTNSVKH